MPSNSLANAAKLRNKFVEVALAYTLSYVICLGVDKIKPAVITILADSSYYSQSQTSTACSQNPNSQFKDFNVSLSDSHKTGLGSSAALVTAFVAAVLKHYLPLASRAPNKLHNLAQIAHCVAQGKIGSGFDVAAAVYGSCIYRRFSPEILEKLGGVGDQNFAHQLRLLVEDEDQTNWDTRIEQSMFSLPPGLRIVMCDVDCGSETPSMVRKVMTWRKESPKESLILWETLSQGNSDLASELGRLRKTPDPTWDNLQDIILTIRSLLREMSTKAGVPIEPPTQTHLLDACTRIKGVVGGVVPGAGGYDALALLVEDKDDVVRELEAFLKTYESPAAVGAIKIGNIQLLKTKQEVQGFRLEPDDLYNGWLLDADKA